MLITLGAILALGAGIGLLAMFWQEICNFLKRAMDKVKQIVAGIVMGSKIFVKKMWDGVQEIVKTYSYDRTKNKWKETIATRTVSESEVPSDIRALLGSSEVDITNQLQMQLSA